MRIIKNTKGAVSLFLIIILLPTITVAGLFLDLSRTKLSQEVVSTSADLALNTVLSDYDKNLKDYFGLLASCQDTSEVMGLSKQYFMDSMVSTGVSTSEAGAYFDNLVSAFVGDDDISDMLQLSVDGAVDISPTANGALKNPALMKSGIIEFMKYRAPVNGVASLFEKITDSEVSKEMENLSKETEMVEAKKKFYEAEEDLIQQAEKAYDAIKAYENYTTWTGKKITDESFLDEMSSFLATPDGSGDNFEKVFKNAHEKMVFNLYNTHETTGTLSITLLQKRTITTQARSTAYSGSNRASAGRIEDLLKEFNNAVSSYCSKKTTLNSKWNSVGGMQNSDYPIQYWVALTNTCSSAYSEYVTATINLWKAANKLENAVEYAADDAMDARIYRLTSSYVTFETPDASGKLSLQSIYDSLSNYYTRNLKTEVTGGGVSSYKSINNQLNSLNTATNNDKLKLETVSGIYNIRNKLNNYQKDFDEAKKLVETAKTETYKLLSKLDAYRNAFNEWKTAANDSELNDSDLALKDREQIQKLEDAGVDLFSKNSVEKLHERLKKIATLCKNFRDDMKTIKYNRTAVINISNFSKFHNAAGLNAGSIVRNENSLRQYADSSFSFEIGAPIQRIEVRDGRTSGELRNGDAYVITDSYHPNIDRTVAGNKLELLEWMKEKFDSPPSSAPVSASSTGYDVNNKDSAKDAKSSVKGKSESTEGVETTENSSGHNFSEWSGAELPSKGEGAAEEPTLTAKLSEVSKFAKEIFSNFSDTFKNSLVNMRDDLYMTDYVFSMFTHDTFDYEGCYDLLSDSEKNGLKPSAAKSKYQSKMSDWQASLKNKTLTLTPRNSSNNWAYGGEIEYILYGDSSNAANKRNAYTKIYLIRFALDVSPVFSFYWDDPLLELLADALEAFAFIPAPLTKTLVCLAITAAEAGVDISYLKAGLPVVLLKKEEDLICNYQSVIMGESQNSSTSNDRIKLQYSDYLKIFLFIKLIGESENVIYTRCGDIVQSNISLSTNNYEFSLAKSQVFFDLKATVLVEPMWSKLLAVDRLGDLSSAKGWRTISISMTRGY